jgi:hypothetical protein
VQRAEHSESLDPDATDLEAGVLQAIDAAAAMLKPNHATVVGAAEKAETLGLAIVGQIVGIRQRLEVATQELDAVLDSIGPPDSEIKRRVRLCLREASQDVDRMLDQLEAAESAACGNKDV